MKVILPKLWLCSLESQDPFLHIQRPSLATFTIKLALQALCLKRLDHSHDVLPANGTFGQLFTAVDAGAHVAAFEHHAVHWQVHADLAQVLVVHRVFF